MPWVCKLEEPWEASRGETEALNPPPVQLWTPGREPRRQSWPSRGRSVARGLPALAAQHTQSGIVCLWQVVTRGWKHR